MPNFQDYSVMLGSKNNTTGHQHTNESMDIIEASWYNDPSSCVGYLYSWEYDDEQDKNISLHPEKSKTKIPVDVKFLINSYQSLDKDNVDYRIMFRPSYKCNVPYYNKLFEKKCFAEFPTGLFIDLPFNILGKKDEYRRWLIVAGANTDNRDFPNWSILFCDYDFKWVYNGKKQHLWGVGRSQNSYNSGIWADYKFSSVENQRKFILPYNDVSKNIFYNQRLAITAPLPTPVVWKLSKVESINPLGVIHYTCVQDLYNPHTDVIEYDQDDNWVACWCDLKAEQNLPGEPPKDPEAPPFEDDNIDYAEITAAGAKPQIKINGSYKTITIKYYNSGELLKNQTPGEWSYLIDDTDVSDLVKVLTTDEINTIKVKFLGSEEYIDKTLVVVNKRGKTVADLRLKIVTI